MALALQVNCCYSDSHPQVTWRGQHIPDAADCTAYLQGPVSRHITDEEHQQIFTADMRALASTNMATNTLSQLLTSEAGHQAWEVGEALAACLLEDEYSVKWPWNTERDKRTPRASLPGADLVGFITFGTDVLLVLGEVKTSADSSCPPNVMTGRSGLVHQLDTLASEIKVHFALLKWLHARCKNNQFWESYQQATKNYLNSGGRALVLFGLLMRDTLPNPLDLNSRALTLAKCVTGLTRVELTAWYLPIPITSWISIIAQGAP